MNHRNLSSCIPSARRAALALVTLAALASAAQANLLANGGFDAPLGTGNGGDTGGFGPFVLFNAPNQGIPEWSLNSGSVDVFTNYLGSGGAVIDMTGLDTGNGGRGPGSLMQTFATTVGTRYAVSFLMGGAATPVVKDMEVSVEGFFATAYSHTFSLDTSQLPFAGALMPQQFEFVANDIYSTLRFTSLVNSSFDGPYLDNVSVTAVPEAQTWALMLGGLGLLSRLWRRAAVLG